MSDAQGGAPAGENPAGTQGSAAAMMPPRPQGGPSGASAPPPPRAGGPVGGSDDGREGGGWSHGGVVFGCMLIVLGVLVLVGQFTALADVVRLWPVIIIVAGVARIFRPGAEAPVKRVFEGLGTAAFGLVLLGNTFGAIPWAVWLDMLSLWPVLLVALGVEIVGHAVHSDWIRALTSVLFIGALAYGVFVLGPGLRGGAARMEIPSGPGVAYETASPHDAAVTTGSATLKLGAIRFTVGAGDALASAAGRAPDDETPKLTTSVVGGVADVSVTDPVAGVVLPPTTLRTLAVTLDRKVRWDKLTLDVGATESEVDLRDLEVGNVAVNVGASTLKLWIGDRAPTADVDISGGVTSVTLAVPKDASVTLASSSGFSSVEVPPGFHHVSGIAAFGDSSWRKTGSGRATIRITLKSGVSDLEVLTY